MLIDIQKLDELPLSSKVQLMEAVMDSLAKNEAEFDAPAWNEKVLAAREHEVQETSAWKTFNQVSNTLKS